MANKIANSKVDKSFSAIMIDLDNFKDINDIYGHQEGDFALITTVNIIKSVISRSDLIARSGGDEFWIVLDTDNRTMIERVIKTLKSKFQEWNNTSNKPYNLTFSYGYKIYDFHQALSTDEFRMEIDRLMYKFKKARVLEGKSK